MRERLLEILGTHLGKILGSIMGLIVGWIIIAFGILKGLFVVLCIGAGFFLGAYLDSPRSGRDFTSRFSR
ncbi:MAG: DUF2273 domain-containing protein [Firmicutes bacterium]|nr:DUF2273 domain-containing protein [Bacillota bacterium]